MKSWFVALALLVSASAQAQSLVITDVHVDIYYSLNDVSLSAAAVGWDFPITLNAGQDLVLSQNPKPGSNPGFNFDTSEVGCYRSLDVPTCNTGWALITIVANGVKYVFWDLNRILTLGGHDPFGNEPNEAQEFTPAYLAKDFDVWLGYADNIHTGPCGGYTTSVGLFGAVNCLPIGFGPESSTYFQATGVPMPDGLVQTQPHHCVYQNAFHQCYDAGVIRIVAHSDLVPLTPVR